MRIARRTRFGAAAGVVVVGLAAGAITIASAGSRSAPAGRWGQSGPATAGEALAVNASVAGAATITLLHDANAGQSAFVDNPPKRQYSAGDVFIFDDPLKTPDGSSTVGDINVTCTAAFQESVCTGTLQLDGRGKISIAGTAPNHPGPFLIPVVGGTSEFIQASGELLVQPQGHGLETLKLFLR